MHARQMLGYSQPHAYYCAARELCLVFLWQRVKPYCFFSALLVTSFLGFTPMSFIVLHVMLVVSVEPLGYPQFNIRDLKKKVLNFHRVRQTDVTAPFFLDLW